MVMESKLFTTISVLFGTIPEWANDNQQSSNHGDNFHLGFGYGYGYTYGLTCSSGSGSGTVFNDCEGDGSGCGTHFGVSALNGSGIS